MEASREEVLVLVYTTGGTCNNISISVGYRKRIAVPGKVPQVHTGNTAWV